MADLQAMFQNLGPTSASLMNGIQMGQQYNANESEQAMREAQMNKIMEETNQAKLMNPLEVQAKQQAVNAGALKAKADENEYHSKVLGDMIPRLESIPEVARHAAAIDMAHQAGIPMDQSDVAHLQSMNANDIVPYLKRAHEHTITQNEKYRQAMDTALVQERTHKYSADSSAAAQRYTADQRANAAAAKTKGVASITEAVQSGKMTAEKAAVAFYGAAQMEQDPVEKERLLSMASQYEKFAMNQRNAGAAGKVDVGAAANLPTQTLPPAMGGNGPALGTAENPIKLN